MKEGKRASRYWWFALLGLCLVPCAMPLMCRRDPQRTIDIVPLGSKLSDLDKHLERGGLDNGRVDKWIPASEKPHDDVHRERTTIDLGEFLVEGIGTYDRWNASTKERDAFTGEISFSHYSSVIPDDLAPSYVIALTYVDGVLRKKQWGILPG